MCLFSCFILFSLVRFARTRTRERWLVAMTWHVWLVVGAMLLPRRVCVFFGRHGFRVVARWSAYLVDCHVVVGAIFRTVCFWRFVVFVLVAGEFCFCCHGWLWFVVNVSRCNLFWHLVTTPLGTSWCWLGWTCLKFRCPSMRAKLCGTWCCGRFVACSHRCRRCFGSDFHHCKICAVYFQISFML